MKKFILAVPALLALAAVSCTKSEVLESNDGEIRFNVVANNATKADAIYCNNNKPSEFTVYAESSNGKTYINGDVIKSTDGGNTWVNASGTRFWPNDFSLDFYAVVNGDIKWNVEAEGTAPASIVDFEVPTDVAAQKDLLYAVKKNQEKTDGADKMDAVALNFRHALSQIVFNAKNTNENLYVEVSGVSIVNVANKNNFTFPDADTDNNMEDADHDGSFNNAIDYEDGSWGKWNTLTSGATVYPVNFETVKVEGNSNLVDLTTNATVKNEYNTNALLMLPQTSTAWNPADDPAPGVNGNADNGSYFLVNCAIYNVSGDSFDPDVDTPLWASQAEHKQVAIPMTINWEQGKKYIYTFIFGEGGGYIPDPDPDPNPDPVLIPVTFEVTVDDFVEVPATDVEMGL